MVQEKIQDLLHRYFEGATTLDEERDLQRYFAGSRIDDSLEAYRPLFSYFAEERAIELPVQKTRTIRLKWSVITGIAASISILLWLGTPKMEPEENFIYIVNGKRVYDETAALAIAENKLQMLAESMQTAKNSMSAFEKLQESSQPLIKISNALKMKNEE